MRFGWPFARKMTNVRLLFIALCLYVLYLMLGTRMLLMPPNFTLILRQRLERVWGEGLITFLDCTH